jgi:hypothetical protein
MNINTLEDIRLAILEKRERGESLTSIEIATLMMLNRRKAIEKQRHDDYRLKVQRYMEWKARHKESQ